MKIYHVKTPISHNGEAFEPGDEIELDDAHADPLLDVSAIEDPAEVKKAAKPERVPKKAAKK
jgi:hypothetical protein